jgi:hypothetical protein
MSEATPKPKAAPIFGVLSVAALFICVVFMFPSADSLVSIFLLVPSLLICGIIFAVVALVRRERYAALQIVGLLLNSASLFWLVSRFMNADWHM